MLTLGHVLEALTGAHPAWATLEIMGANVDSQQVLPGSLFIALPAEPAYSHLAVANAFRHGAKFAIVQPDLAEGFPVIDLCHPETAAQFVQGDQPPFDLEHPFFLQVENNLQALQTIAGFWRQQIEARVIGITGSVGKSTTQDLVVEILGRHYPTLKNSDRYPSEIEVPLALLNLSQDHERAVLEMGFHMPGEIQYLCGLSQPQIGVVTNIGTAHAERAGSIEAIVRGKAELIQFLPSGGVAILNYDDPLVRNMAKGISAQVLFYGTDPAADLWADEVEGFGLEGIRFQVHYQGEDFHLHVPLIGQHSVHTVLRAAAVGLADGLSWQQIVEGLHSTSTQLRLVTVRAESGALIIGDTYNASPQSMLAALNLLEELGGHKIAVLGDMLELGPYEEEGHELIGRRAAEVVDELVCLGQRAQMIASAAASAGLHTSTISTWEDIQGLTDYLRRRLHPEDVVLVKGSQGMGMDQIVDALEDHR